MRGHPKFKERDIVKFKFLKDQEKIGIIYIVDAWGTFFDNSDVSYDIYVEEENTLYKHFSEPHIIEKLGQKDENWMLQ